MTTARSRARDGLRAIAQMEECVAAGVDGPGYWGRLATHLTDHAADLRATASELEEGPPGLAGGDG
jgi:hypothetical protein